MNEIIEQLKNGTAPEGLSVGGSLDLQDTGITSLPEGLIARMLPTWITI